MNIHNDVEYRSIIMRCDNVNSNAFISIPHDIELIEFNNGMEHIWGIFKNRVVILWIYR